MLIFGNDFYVTFEWTEWSGQKLPKVRLHPVSQKETFLGNKENRN